MGHPRIRILLADDQREMLETVARLLEDEFDVIAAVANGERAIEAAARLASRSKSHIPIRPVYQMG
jgi:CheY-like chemotaxis protein